jgi:hypothetical protein
MIVIIILLIAAVFYLMFSSVKLYILLDRTTRLVELSYTLFKFQAELVGLSGKIYFAGIRIKKFNLTDIKSLGKSESAAEKLPKKEIKKKSMKFNVLDMGNIIYYLKKAYYPIRKIRIKRLDIQITDGFSDPHKTGQLYALYMTARGIFPELMSHISFRPDFAADKIDIKGEGLVKLRIFFILVPVLQILTDKMKEFIKQPFLKIRKGTSYV